MDDSDDSQRSFHWLVHNFLKMDDEVHLLHVIPRMAYTTTYSVPALDFSPGIDRDKYEDLVRKSEAFIVKRFLSVFPEESKSTPIVHIIKSETDTSSVGHIVCQKAAELKANCVAMGSHNKGAVKEFFLGSVSHYIMANCKVPVMVVKGI
ncbi:hypothetical protein FOA52_010919 [Chlamydomonas sp. UWO 241]|nr:hypothetical protein FOA52_010919 [Chlamydomonas sp. UWO 241]